MNSDQVIRIHNTRLFPKGGGGSKYRLTGIAGRCDWAILTDSGRNDVAVRGDLLKPPSTVFLSLRSGLHAIPYFYENILPMLHQPFVLVTGSEDITIPNQVDKRWRPFTVSEKEIIFDILNDQRVVHWFAENRDMHLEKMSSLPLGLVYMSNEPDRLKAPIPTLPVKERELRVLCAHRIREGAQWDVRRQLTSFCQQKLSKFSTVLTEEISERAFQQQVREHSFVICAQGGGLDPSPKAWFSILNGAIPIIKSSALDDAYSQLPVVIVDEWHENCLNESKLLEWREQLAPYYDPQQLWSQTVHRLSLDYWWDKISEKLT